MSLASKLKQRQLTGHNTPHIIVEALAGTGKEQPVDCLVQTPTGPTAIGRLKAGDVIFSLNGQSQTVLGVFPQGIKPCYKVTFRDGTSTRCGLSHLWIINNKGKYGDSIKIMSLKELLESGLGNGYYKHRIPLCGPVQYPEKTFLIDPYLLGLLIGDGHLSGSSPGLSFNANDQGIIDEVIKLSKKHHLKLAIRNTGPNALQTTLIPENKTIANGPNWIKDELKRLGLNVKSEKKFIPSEYLLGSIEQRKKLLAGLMDSDGHCTANRTGFNTTAKQLVKDIQTLVQSLGGTAIAIAPDTRANYCYPVNVKTNFCPFGFSSKATRWKPSTKNPPSRYIVSIEKQKMCKQVCIKVSSEDSAYLTDNFIVTHNTTTLVEGLKNLIGDKVGIIPSAQQAAIWDCLNLSRGNTSSICFVAFNTTIAEELQRRVPTGCSAMTLHSLGMRAVTSEYGLLPFNDYRSLDILATLLNKPRQRMINSEPEVCVCVDNLVDLCKKTLTEPTEAGLDELCNHFEVDCNGYRSRVYSLVADVMEESKKTPTCIDYNDMIWLPVVKNLLVKTYDLLLVDEAQDLNRCQQELAFKAGRRLVFVGDRHQAIYGFAGADSGSMGHLYEYLIHTVHGCEVLPLTVTRRCSQSVTKEAQRIVSRLECLPEAPEGSVQYTNFGGQDTFAEYQEADVPIQSYRSHVKDDDMIVCRVTAPLIGECFKLIKLGHKANVLGRNISKGLITTINKVKAANIQELRVGIEQWAHAETTKELLRKPPREMRLIAIQDKCDCILALCDGAASVEHVCDRVRDIFSAGYVCPTCNGKQQDEATKCPNCGVNLVPIKGIRLCTIHKAKGLEANRVFFLEPKGATCPHPMAKSKWQVEQEWNLRYVGITRAIKELVYVS